MQSVDAVFSYSDDGYLEHNILCTIEQTTVEGHKSFEYMIFKNVYMLVGNPVLLKLTIGKTWEQSDDSAFHQTCTVHYISFAHRLLHY